MTASHDKRFPGEDETYRDARNALLAAELELETKVHEVAELRRNLPEGGPIKEDYVFQTTQNGVKRDVRLSELFRPGDDTLFLYSYMYGPNDEAPCPACSSLVDGFDGVWDHIADRISVAVVAKSPIDRFAALAQKRGWTNVRLLSSAKNTYNTDYLAENSAGFQLPAANIFVRRNGQIRHFWGAELLYVDRPGHPRHVDQIWPIWNILDLTPGGRGTDWFPQLSYPS